MKQLLLSALVLSLMTLTACNISTPDVNPSPEILITASPTEDVTSIPTPTLTPSNTPTQEISDVPVVVASRLPTQDDLAPQLNVTPIATQGPCEVTILDGEALTGALLRVPCGNEVSNGLINAVVAFNENIADPNFVSPGLTFFVPLPSPTPIPEGADMTETVAAGQGITVIGSFRFPENQPFGCYEIVEGDQLVSIAELYGTSLEVLSALNPNLGWGGCDFTNPSGGPTCSPNLRIGECVTVPEPTGTPIPTTTPSGNETATPTPTHEPARLISPPQGAIVNQRVTLEWVSVGILRSGEIYLIDIQDRTTGMTTSYNTSNTRYTIPDSLIPSDGQTHEIAWRVSVARRNSDNTVTVVGGIGEWTTFQWQSR